MLGLSMLKDPKRPEESWCSFALPTAERGNNGPEMSQCSADALGAHLSAEQQAGAGPPCEKFVFFHLGAMKLEPAKRDLGNMEVQSRPDGTND